MLKIDYLNKHTEEELVDVLFALQPLPDRLLVPYVWTDQGHLDSSPFQTLFPIGYVGGDRVFTKEEMLKFLSYFHASDPNFSSCNRARIHFHLDVNSDKEVVMHKVDENTWDYDFSTMMSNWRQVVNFWKYVNMEDHVLEAREGYDNTHRKPRKETT